MSNNYMVEFIEAVGGGKIPKGLRLMVNCDGSGSKPSSWDVEKALEKQLGIKLNGHIISGKWKLIS